MSASIPSTTSDPAAAAATAVQQIEAAKRKAAFEAVADHFHPSMRYVGIGSGSTIVYGVEAIAATLAASSQPRSSTTPLFIPTGSVSRSVIERFGLTPIAFDALPADAVLDVAFDGADEVDSELNCIKGGGACLFQEKLVVCRSRKFVCIADYRKDSARLLTAWPAIPIEVAPMAAAAVLVALSALGAEAAAVRQVAGRPVVTDQAFWIVDAKFKGLLAAADVKEGKDGSGKNGIWDVDTLARRIKLINGVLEVGLFHGLDGVEAQKVGLPGGQKPVAAYFGLANGETQVRHAAETK